MKQIILLKSVRYGYLDRDDRMHEVDPDDDLLDKIEAKIKEGYQLVAVIVPTTDERIAYMEFVGGRI